MSRRNVADIAPDHLFLAQRLAFMLPRSVIEVVVDHRAAAIVPQAGGRHRRPLQVAAEVLHAMPGSPGLLREVYLPVPAHTAPADNAATGAHRGCGPDPVSTPRFMTAFRHF